MGRAMAAPFAEDGVVIGFDGSVSSGKQTIGAEMSSIFADHQTGRYAVKVQSVRALGPDAVILRASPDWSRRATVLSTPRPTPIRVSLLRRKAANGGSCCFKTLQHSSMAALSWSRT
jgi:uncharacterized protein (TIGR02246 family)